MPFAGARGRSPARSKPSPATLHPMPQMPFLEDRMSKRKTGRRRHPCGKIVRTPTPNDDGTPELQAIRKAILGEKANGLPLSQASPIDVLCARGYLDATHVQAARAYQAAHRAAYGASSARSASGVAATPSTGTTDARARLQAVRNLSAWRYRLAHVGYRPWQVFLAWVIDERTDSTVMAAMIRQRSAMTTDDTGRIAAVRRMLDLIANTPRQHVSHDEIERANTQEMHG